MREVREREMSSYVARMQKAPLNCCITMEVRIALQCCFESATAATEGRPVRPTLIEGTTPARRRSCLPGRLHVRRQDGVVGGLSVWRRRQPRSEVRLLIFFKPAFAKHLVTERAFQAGMKCFGSSFHGTTRSICRVVKSVAPKHVDDGTA